MQGKYDPLVEAVGGDLSTDGTDVACDCPKCGKHKLYVNRDTGLFFCFTCEFSGRAVDLVADLHNITARAARQFVHKYTYRGSTAGSDEVRETVRRLTEQPIKARKAMPPKVMFPSGAVPLRNTPGEQYLLKRGFRREHIKPYRLLYVPYCKQYNPASNHVIFPCYGKNDSLEFWTSRAAWDPVTRGPKSSGPSGVSKKAIVYGLHEFQPYRGDGRIILVEGPLDAIALQRNGCALLGKYLSDLQIQRLLTIGRRRGIIVCLDSSELQASWDAAARIARWDDRVEVYVGTTAPYKDAAEALADGKDPVEIIKRSAVRFSDTGLVRSKTVTAR